MNLSRVFKFSLSHRQFQWVVVVAILSLVVGLYFSWIAATYDNTDRSRTRGDGWGIARLGMNDVAMSSVRYADARINYVSNVLNSMRNMPDVDVGAVLGRIRPLPPDTTAQRGQDIDDANRYRRAGRPFRALAAILFVVIIVRCREWEPNYQFCIDLKQDGPNLYEWYLGNFISVGLLVLVTPIAFFLHEEVVTVIREEEKHLLLLEQEFRANFMVAYNSAADGKEAWSEARYEIREVNHSAMESFSNKHDTIADIALFDIPSRMLIHWGKWWALAIISITGLVALLDYSISYSLRLRIDRLGYDSLNRDECWLLIKHLRSYAWRLPLADHILVIPHHDQRTTVEHIIQLQRMRFRFDSEYRLKKEKRKKPRKLKPI